MSTSTTREEPPYPMSMREEATYYAVKDAVAAKEREVALLRAALEPFARLALTRRAKGAPDGEAASIDLGTCRAALEALDAEQDAVDRTHASKAEAGNAALRAIASLKASLPEGPASVEYHNDCEPYREWWKVAGVTFDSEEAAEAFLAVLRAGGATE